VKPHRNHYKAEPSNIFLVILQAVVFVSYEIWVGVITHYSPHLYSEDEKDRAKDLSKENNHFNQDPHFRRPDPVVRVQKCRSRVQFVEQCVHRSKEIDEHAEGVHELKGEAMCGVILWRRLNELENPKDQIDCMGDS